VGGGVLEGKATKTINFLKRGAEVSRSSRISLLQRARSKSQPVLAGRRGVGGASPKAKIPAETRFSDLAKA